MVVLMLALASVALAAPGPPDGTTNVDTGAHIKGLPLEGGGDEERPVPIGELLDRRQDVLRLALESAAD
jgi:hypothetical protein